MGIFNINKYFVHQVDITAKLFEGNNVDREFLVYRTIIQVKHKVTVTESDLILCRQHLLNDQNKYRNGDAV